MPSASVSFAADRLEPRAAESLPGRQKRSRSRIKDLEVLLRRLDNSIKFESRPDLSSFVNWRGTSEAPVHRWLRYREAYSPNLVTKLALGSHIFDPFCGCGSILIGAAENGSISTGTDINPLAVFAARVKLSPLTRSRLHSIQQFVDELPERMEGSPIWPAPSLSIASKVFEPTILDTLLRIRFQIEAGFSNDLESRNFLHLAWIAILEAVGSYFKEGNGIKYRNKKRLKTGYIRRRDGEWQQARFGVDQEKFVHETFCTHVRMMLHDTKYWRKGRWRDQTVMEASVLDIEPLFSGQAFDSIIFSPPYANRFDYFESMKVELWFGGFVDSYEAANRLRKASLRSHLGADLRRPYERVTSLEKLIELMDQNASSWRMGVPDLLRGYFDDMRTTLSGCRKIAPSGKCFIVVGNSAFAGVIIPTDVLIAMLGRECGFRNAEIWVTRHLTVAPQQRNQLCNLEGNMRESVVVLS